MLLGWPVVREMSKKKQRLSLAAMINDKLKLVPTAVDAKTGEGKTNVEVEIRRAIKKAKDDYGLVI